MALASFLLLGMVTTVYVCDPVKIQFGRASVSSEVRNPRRVAYATLRGLRVFEYATLRGLRVFER